MPAWRGGSGRTRPAPCHEAKISAIAAELARPCGRLFSNEGTETWPDSKTHVAACSMGQGNRREKYESAMRQFSAGLFLKGFEHAVQVETAWFLPWWDSRGDKLTHKGYGADISAQRHCRSRRARKDRGREQLRGARLPAMAALLGELFPLAACRKLAVVGEVIRKLADIGEVNTSLFADPLLPHP